MIGRITASVSTLALLASFVAAPYTHLHPSEQEAANASWHAHGHGHAVLHSHTTSHDGGHDSDVPADADPHDADGFSIDAFVFAPVKNHALTDVVVVLPQAVMPAEMARASTRISPQIPPDYGSPPILPSAPRGPPVLPPPAI